MKSDKNLKVKYDDPLNPLDTAETTYGCRANNPDICGSCYLDGVCAFVRDDNMCLRPSKAWKKQFEKLGGTQ